MKSIFKNKLNLFLFFLIIINLIYIKNISYFKLDILKNSFNKNWVPIYSIYRQEVIESKYLLNKNGIFYFTTLNGMGFDIQMLGKYSNSIYPPYHINFFNPKSIELLLKKIGFKILFIDTPGKLDLSIVENNSSFLKGAKKIFFEQIIKNTSKKYKEKFQEYLQANKLSSHMRIVVKK